MEMFGRAILNPIHIIYKDWRHWISDLNTACFTWTTDALIPSGADYILDSDDADNVVRAVGMIDSTFEAEGWSRGTNLDALFLFLDDSDHAGHAHGFEMGLMSTMHGKKKSWTIRWGQYCQR